MSHRWTPERLLAELDELDIPHTTVDHPPVFTVAEADALRDSLPGSRTKSLFLRAKRGGSLWLVTTLSDRTVDLRRLAAALGAGRFSFASPERLERHLGVTPGSVTPFAVVNDTDARVSVAIEGALLAHDPIQLHPLVNTRTTAIASDDLLRFLAATGHPARVLGDHEL